MLDAGADGIVGWAWNSERPQEVVRVVVSVGNEPMATAVANRFDLDVVRRQVGPGVAGFSVRLPRLPGGKPPFSVTVRSAEGRALGQPLLVHSAEQMAACVGGKSRPSLEGMVDLLASGRLQGWVWDPAAPEAVIEVDIYDNETRLGRARAELSRDDLRGARKRDGACAFAFDLPATLLDMRLHCIRVIAVGTTFELGNSPLRFGPMLGGGLIEEVAKLRADMDAILTRVAGVTDAGGALQREILAVLAERVSAYAAIQGEALERRVDLALAVNATPTKRVSRPRG